MKVVKWSGGQVVSWSGGQVVRWSGGQVVRGRGAKACSDGLLYVFVHIQMDFSWYLARWGGVETLVRMVCNTHLVMNEIRHETNITMRPVTSGKMGPKCPSCLTGLQFHHQIISPIHVALETDWPSDWEGRTNDWTYSWRNLVCPKNWGAHFSAISKRKFDLLLLSVMYKWAEKRIW